MKRQTIIKVGTNGKIAHYLYTKEEAEKAFESVSMLKGNSEHWIIEIFREGEKYYIVAPKDTYYILRHSEFTMLGKRWEVQRYK